VNAALECKALTGGRGGTTAFRDVDLSLSAGSVVGLFGPNGAGKTTLLMTIAGLLPARGGTVSVSGESLRNGRPGDANKAGIVLVPDNRCLFTTMTVEENLRVAARRGGLPADSVLTIFPALGDRWHLLAGALSGGEQQMLAVGRALIQRPKVLLLDELSLGLAPLMVETLFGTVARIASDHQCAVLLVEQHVNLALEVVDEAIVLTRGAVALRVPAADLVAQPERLREAYFGHGEGGSVDVG
jgi:branched-chain amino acid transport system ATP-binding protein